MNLVGDNQYCQGEDDLDAPTRPTSNQTSLPFAKRFLPLAASFFIQSSLAVNLSYSTLWIMDGLIKARVNEGVAFSLSIMYGSLFFCLSTLLYLASGYLLYYLSNYVKPISFLFSIFYSLLLYRGFHSFNVGTICLIILCTGLQLSIANFY